MPGESHRPLAVVTETLDARCADWLSQRCEVLWARLDDAPDDQRLPLDDALPRAEALIVRTYTRVDADLLDRAPQLRVVGRAGVGLDNVDIEACRSRGIAVVYTPDANTQAVVEYVLGLMLDWARPRPMDAMSDVIAAQRFHELRKTLVGRQLSDLTLGVLGFGRIGSRLTEAATALGMRVQATDLVDPAELTRRHPGVTGHERFVGFVGHDTLYRTSDVLSVHVDGRDTNRRMLDAGVFDRLGPRVLVINAARGMLLDAHAAAAFARSRPEARLVLDVHDPEPPPPPDPSGNGGGDAPSDAGRPPAYPLWRLPNVVLMPHLASRTDTALENMSWVVRDIVAVLEGQEPSFPAW